MGMAFTSDDKGTGFSTKQRTAPVPTCFPNFSSTLKCLEGVDLGRGRNPTVRQSSQIAP